MHKTFQGFIWRRSNQLKNHVKVHFIGAKQAMQGLRPKAVSAASATVADDGLTHSKYMGIDGFRRVLGMHLTIDARIGVSAAAGRE